MPKGHGVGGWNKKRVVVRKNERDLPNSLPNGVSSTKSQPPKHIALILHCSLRISVHLSSLYVNRVLCYLLYQQIFLPVDQIQLPLSSNMAVV